MIDLAKTLDTIDKVLLGWEKTKDAHNLTAELIAEGKKILEAARDAAKQ